MCEVLEKKKERISFSFMTQSHEEIMGVICCLHEKLFVSTPLSL